MTTQAKHTALPWQVVQRPSAYGEYCHLVRVRGGRVNSDGFGDEAAANAAFIVRACNSHEALVEACQYGCQHGKLMTGPELLEAVADWIVSIGQTEYVGLLREKAGRERAALAKALE